MTARAALSLSLLALASIGCRSSAPVDGGPRPDAGAFALPVVPDACPTPTTGLPRPIVVDGATDLAVAISETELGVAYVEHGADGALALRLQRVSLEGDLLGGVVEVASLGEGMYGAAGIATDGAVYVICGSAGMGATLECGTVPVGGTVARPGASIEEARVPALAFGAGGFLLAYISSTGAELFTQPLDANGRVVGAPRVVATDTGRPSLAPTALGFALGYGADVAYAQELDAFGVPVGAPLPLGDALPRTPVAVTFTAEAIGASWIAASGDAWAALGSAPPVLVGAGANGGGRVAIGAAANGFVASWSGGSGSIGLAALDAEGALMGSGTSYDARSDDAPHALVASAERFFLVVATNGTGTPVQVVPLTCPTPGP